MKERKARMKDINAKAMQDLTFNSIVKIKKNRELELERMKPIMEKYVKRHIIPKIKKAAEKGVTPQKFVDDLVVGIKDLWSKLKIILQTAHFEWMIIVFRQYFLL